MTSTMTSAPAPSPVVTVPPSGQVPVAVLGAGYIAGYHLDILRGLKGVEVVGACDPDAGRLDALCRQWNVPHRGRTLAELMEHCRPAAVHVLVPPPLHHAVTGEALRAGVNVLVEKPMALQTSECADLQALARDRGLLLGVNHNAVFHPAFQKLLRDVRALRLGRVEHVVSVNNLPLAQLESGEHDHWMFRSPANVLFEQAPHPLSQICALLGAVKEVRTAVSGERVLRTGARFHTGWQMSLSCEQGTADLFLAFGRSFPESKLIVIGQDAVAEVDLIQNVYSLDRRTRYLEPVDRCLRLLKKGGALAWSGLAGFVGYGLTTLRLRGRRDPYYLGMKGSIEAFYRRLRGAVEPWDSSRNGRDVIVGLERAAAQVPVVIAPPSPARPEPREGDVLVLGGTGFIGRHLLRALHQAGHSVRVLARRPALVPSLAGGGPAVVTGDIRDVESVRRAVAGCKAVIHLVSGAPPTWEEFERLYVGGTRIVAEACLDAKVPQLLFASSIAALYLGSRRTAVTEDTPPDPKSGKRSEYTRAKAACEELLQEMHRARGLPVTIFRPGVVVGEGGLVEHSGVGYWPSPALCLAWGRDVRHPLPFVLAGDVADALVRAVGRDDLAGQTFNLVGGVSLSAAEYVEELRRATRRDVRLHRQSVAWWWGVDVFKWLVKLAARKPGNVFPSYRDLASRSLVAPFDTAKTRRVLGWKPESDRERFLEKALGHATERKHV
jgi:nucleoside-diphosphate-sugar epimerase/predicted dehydrogenase